MARTRMTIRPFDFTDPFVGREFVERYRFALTLFYNQVGILEWLCPVTAKWRREGYRPGTYGVPSPESASDVTAPVT